MHINDFDYELPQRLIAQTPAEKRDFSRLMVVHRDSGEVEHKHFYDILDYLKAGDCLVLNNSKVLPARLYGRKEGTGANIEFLLIKRIEGDTWETMVKPGKRLKPGDAVSFSDDKLFRAVVKDYGEDGTRIVEFEYEGIFLERLEELGKMPLPPYIERDNNSEDKDRYQTVYAKNEGSVAAPTAGLHFTPELLEKAKAKGVKLAYVTLHVGIGTFRPVKVENIEEHHMHFEEYLTASKREQDWISATAFFCRWPVFFMTAASMSICLVVQITAALLFVRQNLSDCRNRRRVLLLIRSNTMHGIMCRSCLN